jgi:hypothetical protein
MNKTRGEVRSQITRTILEVKINAVIGEFCFYSCVKQPQGITQKVASIKAYKGPAELPGLLVLAPDLL